MTDLYHVITTISALYGVPTDLAIGLATVESGLNTEAMGAHGEVGLYQIKPSTAKLSADALRMPWVNTAAAMSYLTHLRDLCGAKYIHCYNAGPKARFFPKQSNYEKKVLFQATREKKGKCNVDPKF